MSPLRFVCLVFVRAELSSMKSAVVCKGKSAGMRRAGMGRRAEPV